MRVSTNGSLVIEFDRLERVAALQRRIEVPRSSITGARFHRHYEDPGRAWRVAGTWFPRLLAAGRFRRDKRWEILYVRRPRGVRRFVAADVLEVETSGRWARVIVSVAPAVGEQVVEWARSEGVAEEASR